MKHKKVNISLDETKWLLPYYVLLDGVLLIIIGVIWLCMKTVDLPMLWGFFVGNLLSLANFYFMGVSVQQTIYNEKKKAMLNMNVSYVIRYLGMFFILGILLYFKQINLLTAFFPLLFPKLAYTIDYTFRKSEE